MRFCKKAERFTDALFFDSLKNIIESLGRITQ